MKLLTVSILICGIATSAWAVDPTPTPTPSATPALLGKLYSEMTAQELAEWLKVNTLPTADPKDGSGHIWLNSKVLTIASTPTPTPTPTP